MTAAGVLGATGTGTMLVLIVELDSQLFHPELVGPDGGPVGVEIEEEDDADADEDADEELDELDDPHEDPALTENCVESRNNV